MHTPGNPRSKSPNPTSVVTGAITTGLMYLAAIPHRPLKPNIMLIAEPAMNAPCVARIPNRNLCNTKTTMYPSECASSITPMVVPISNLKLLNAGNTYPKLAATNTFPKDGREDIRTKCVKCVPDEDQGCQ